MRYYLWLGGGRGGGGGTQREKCSGKETFRREKGFVEYALFRSRERS